MGINFDDFWIVGSVRIRASAPDPFAGLRGRAYIAERKLDKKPVEKIESPAVAEAKNEIKEKLIEAINQRATPFPGKTKIVFASGSMGFTNGSGMRRFWPLSEMNAEEQ